MNLTILIVVLPTLILRAAVVITMSTTMAEVVKWKIKWEALHYIVLFQACITHFINVGSI